MALRIRKSRFCLDSKAASSRVVVLSVVKNFPCVVIMEFHSALFLLGDGDQRSEDGEGCVGPPEGRRFALCNVR